MKPRLGSAGVKLIHSAIETLFQKIKEHTFGNKNPTGKSLYVRYTPELTLKGIYDASAAEEGYKPDPDVLKTLLEIAGSYLDAVKEKTKAQTVQTVRSFIQDAAAKGVATDIQTVLGGQLYNVMGKITSDVQRILETESTIFRNVSLLDGIVKANTAVGIEDPTVAFITVRDAHRCEECTKLHCEADKITPKVWKLSEVSTSYHKKGEPFPSTMGLHPHCRCLCTTILPGYGFDTGGRVQYKYPGYSEFKHQRGIPQSVPEAPAK